MKQGFRVLDSDLHIIEPPDLWVRYVDAEFRDSVPTKNPYPSSSGLQFEGKRWGTQKDDVRFAEWYASRSYAASAERWKSFADRNWDATSQLEAMDEEGIDVAVLYPTSGLAALGIPNLDHRLAAAMARAYNDWLHDFMGVDRKRLLGAAIISPFDVSDAIAEAQRAKELGFKAVFIRPNIVMGRNWHDTYYDPLWTELESLQLPLAFHESVSSLLPHAGDIFRKDFMLEHVACHPLESMLAVISFCGGGTLERHPNLKVGFLEANCSWLPFLMWRLDEHVEWVGDGYSTGLSMMPSEYFRRQCYVSIECDEEPGRNAVEEGWGERIVFSTDFPHGDCKYPRGTERFLKLPISDEAKRDILWNNCATFYGLE